MKSEYQKPFSDIAKAIMDETIDLSQGMSKIDEMLYSYYDLSEEEISFIEKSEIEE